MDKELKELIVVKGKVIEQERGYHANSGKEISYEQGAKMIKRHFDENPDDVIAQYTGKVQIEKILAQPGCVGFRSFYGINELGIRTLVFVGVDSDGNNILEIPGSEFEGTERKKKGIIVSGVNICPPYCGGATGTSEESPSWNSNY